MPPPCVHAHAAAAATPALTLPCHPTRTLSWPSTDALQSRCWRRLRT